MRLVMWKMTRVFTVWLTVALAATLCCGAVKLVDDPPPVKPPKPGKIAGRISSKTPIVSLHAVSRVTKKKYQPDAFSVKTGSFAFSELPGDAAYDLCLRLEDAREIEGIDLAFVDSRLLKLAAERRKQLGLPPDRDKEFTQADADKVLAYARDMEDFMEDRRVLYIKGHGRRATMLIEQMRLRKFVAASGAARPGKIIWRVELWYFLEQRGGWERIANQERMLRRIEDTPANWSKTHIEYYPKLSVRIDSSGKAPAVNFTVPDKSDPTRGRPAGSDPKMKTKPYILGLDAKPTTRAATQPRTATPKTLIIDVRTAWEFDEDRIGEAINIPYNKIAGKIGGLGVKKGHPIVVYGRSGKRAGLAMATLKGLGYTNVTNAGGLADIKKKMSRKK
jgi:phage shock protein E